MAKIKWRPFTKSRKFVRKLNLACNMKWRDYCKSGKKPDNIPANPNVVYKNKGWKSWGDWPGTDYIAEIKLELGLTN